MVYIYSASLLKSYQKKIELFPPNHLGKQANNTFCPLPCAGHMGWHARAHGLIAHVRILQFSSIFKRSSVLKCLGTWDEFSPTCIVFKNLLRTIDLRSSYP